MKVNSVAMNILGSLAIMLSIYVEMAPELPDWLSPLLLALEGGIIAFVSYTNKGAILGLSKNGEKSNDAA